MNVSVGRLGLEVCGSEFQPCLYLFSTHPSRKVASKVRGCRSTREVYKKAVASRGQTKIKHVFSLETHAGTTHKSVVED